MDSLSSRKCARFRSNATTGIVLEAGMEPRCNPLNMLRSYYADIFHDVVNTIYRRTLIWFYAEGFLQKNEEDRTVDEDQTVGVHISFTVRVTMRYILQANHKLKILFGAFDETHQPTIAAGTREKEVIMFRTSTSAGQMNHLGEKFDPSVMRRYIDLSGVAI